MKLKKKNASKAVAMVLAISALGMSTVALGEGHIGGGVAVGYAPYKSYDTVWAPVPVFNYKHDRFYINTLKAGINLWDGETTQVDWHVSYLPLSFKGSRTDNEALKKLDQRKWTMLSGVGIAHQFNQGRTELKASVAFDVLNRSDSVLLNASASHRFSVTEKWSVSPEVGLLWVNKKHNNYYYGISAKEAQRSGLERYSAGAAMHPYLGVNMNYGLTESVSLFGSARVDFLPSKVKDSPMVGRSTIGGVAFGVIYRFK